MILKKQAYLEEIRRKAEQIAKKQDFVIPVEKAEEYQKLVHELNVHQIELEIQNEELLATQFELEKARNRYVDLFNNAPVGYVILDRSGFIRQSNQTFADMVGHDVARLHHRPLSEFLSAPSRHTFLSQYKAFFKNPSGKQIEVEIREGAANPRALRFYGKKEVSGDCTGNPARESIRIIATDVTEQRAAELAKEAAHRDLALRHRIAETMLESDDSDMFQNVLRILLDHFASPFGYFGYIDEDRNLVCPSMTRDVFSACAVEDKSIVFPRPDWAGIWGESLLQKRTVCKDADLVLPAGHIPLFNALAVPIVNKDELVGQIVLANKSEGYGDKDVSDMEDIAGWIAPVLGARIERDRQQAKRVKAENDLRHAQRMESIGVLAGGVAHDFNNLLTPIIGYADLMMADMTRDESLRRNVEEISRAAHRAKDLVGQLLAFSRKQMLDVQPLNINTALRRLSKILERLIREDIEITYDLADGEILIRGDYGQLDQVVMNLVSNAQDAMSDGGKIRIETGRMQVASPLQEYGFTIAAGDYGLIRVRDTGEGIPEAVLPHIFDPFFTTKEIGKGTGMGLATCYGIVKQHGGYIWVESEKASAGSVFTTLFPMFSTSEIEASPEKTDSPVHSEPQRNATIMVVEDEPAVRMMAVLGLEKKGFAVLEMNSPLKCIERVDKEGLSFDLLLTDVVMPGCDGKELFKQLKERMPDLKVLYMSGYTDNVIGDKGLLKDGVDFIGKPFSIEGLTLKVREVLGDK